MARRFPAAQSPPSPCCQAAEPNSKPRVAGRGFGEGHPEHAVGGSQAWTRRGALEDSQLVPQGEVLEHQGALGPESEEEGREDQGQHAAILDEAGCKFNADETVRVSRRHNSTTMFRPST